MSVGLGVGTNRTDEPEGWRLHGEPKGKREGPQSQPGVPSENDDPHDPRLSYTPTLVSDTTPLPS